MPNHPGYWEGSPEFDKDRPEFPVCKRCGYEFDPLASFRARWVDEGRWEPCNECNGWEDGE